VATPLTMALLPDTHHIRVGRRVPPWVRRGSRRARRALL